MFAFGDAANVVAPDVAPALAEDLEASRSGRGYWIVTSNGRRLLLRRRPYLGGVNRALRPFEKVTSISATPTGRGYWLFARLGRVVAFGDAPT